MWGVKFDDIHRALQALALHVILLHDYDVEIKYNNSTPFMSGFTNSDLGRRGHVS